MGLPLAARLTSPAGRTALFYFTLYSIPAVANPYLAIWLAEQGLTTPEIGTINAAPIFIMILLNLVVGRIADRASDWRQVIVWGAFLACLAPVVLFFVDGFWGILIVWSMVVVPFQAIAPVTDAAAIRMLRRQGGEFGLVRVWGTVGFLVITLSAGYFLDRFGPAAFVPIILAVSVWRALISLLLPYFRADAAEKPHGVEPHYEAEPVSPLVATRLKEIWRPWFMLTLLGAAFMHGSHMLQMGLGALLWKEQGISPQTIALLWAIAPTGEIVIMLYFGRMAKRFSARHLILAAGIFSVLRWVGFALEPGVWGYAALQVLHLGSFGLAYMGIVNFIANWTSEDIAAQAQSAFIVIRQVGMVITLAGFGALAATMGNDAYLIAAGLGAIGSGLVMWSLVLMSPKQERAEDTAH